MPQDLSRLEQMVKSGLAARAAVVFRRSIMLSVS
jgi:hypothetical protein